MTLIRSMEPKGRPAWMAALRRLADLLAIAAASAIILAHLVLPHGLVIPLYGILVIGYVVGKMILAEIYCLHSARRVPRDTTELSIDTAIAFYNEDPSLLEACIRSVLAQQNIRLGRVIAVDDGSESEAAFDHVKRVFADDPRVLVLRNEQQVGKRHALGLAFDRLAMPYAALLDSDTVLEPRALSHLLAAMDEDTAAVTANIRALNRDTNWLSRIIDARYRSAFMVERAAQSVMGSALCASGVLSVYRSSFLRAVKPEWIDQHFLGQPVHFGDDRRSTALALQRGRVIIALDAVAFTQVPTNLIQFMKQQLRWNKSFLRESGLAVRDFGVLSFPGLLSFAELFFWFFYLSTIANILIFDPIVGSWSILAIWLAFVLAAGLFRNMTLILREPRLILLAPLYSLAHVLILTPLRVAALLTIRDNRWGTR
jgi:hyaluronan synthase